MYSFFVVEFLAEHPGLTVNIFERNVLSPEVIQIGCALGSSTLIATGASVVRHVRFSKAGAFYLLSLSSPYTTARVRA